jgi:phosphotransferase system HPr (HPr) family protein
MYEKRCTVSEPLGLCGRSAGAIAQKAIALLSGHKPQDEIFICRANIKDDGWDKANACSILRIMMLCAGQGSELIVCAENDSLKDLVDELAKFIENIGIN